MFAQPRDEPVKPELIFFIEPGQEVIRFVGIGCQPDAVDGQKCVRSGEGGALIAIDKGMILRQALL